MEKIEELQQIRRTIEQGGGADKIKKQHESGKKTAAKDLQCFLMKEALLKLTLLLNTDATNSICQRQKPR